MRNKKKKEEIQPTLKDALNQDVLKKLQEKKHELKAMEEEEERKEEERKREERRLKEKNKSFEELLNDSKLDWKRFK